MKNGNWIGKKMKIQSFNPSNLLYPIIKYYKEDRIMICDIAVTFKVPKHTYTVLNQINTQNGEVGIALNDDGTITLSAQMLDFTNSEYDWPENE